MSILLYSFVPAKRDYNRVNKFKTTKVNGKEIQCKGYGVEEVPPLHECWRLDNNLRFEAHRTERESGMYQCKEAEERPVYGNKRGVEEVC